MAEGMAAAKEELKMRKEVADLTEQYQFDQAIKLIWETIAESDSLINRREVWKLTGGERGQVLEELIKNIRQIGTDLQPFIPETSQKILAQFNNGAIKKHEPLFPRLEK